MGRLIIPQFPSKEKKEAWFADSAYQEAGIFSQEALVMHNPLFQEGGENVVDHEPKLQIDFQLTHHRGFAWESLDLIIELFNENN